jgi:dephospho-CoA kinase
VEAFGREILAPDGPLDRSRLAAIVFSDPEARHRLNEIVHPLVRQWMVDRQQEAARRGDALVVLDVPLLFETRGLQGLDAVVLVYAPEKLQLKRLMEERGMDEEAARARLAAQMPIEEKRRLASHVIINTGTLEDLRTETERIWTDVQAAVQR